MEDPPTTTQNEALSRAVAAHREVLLTAVALADRKRAAGYLSIAQHRDQLHAAHAAYDRDVALAGVAAGTGWQTWVGVAGVLYARLPRSSPSQVVRAPSAQALREAIERAQDGQR